MKHKPSRSILSVSVLAIIAAPVYIRGAADTITGASPAWVTTTAWSTGAIPTASDNAIIAATGSVNLQGSNAAFNPTATLGTTTIQDLQFNSVGAVTLTNASTSRDMYIILNGGRGAGIPLISTVGDFAYGVANGASKTLQLQLDASGSVDVEANVLSIGGIIRETGSQSLNKTGAGTLALSAANSFSGGLTVTAGNLRASGNAGALGAGNLTLAGGGLELLNDTGLAFNRPTTVTANTTITSNRATAAATNTTHTLGTLNIGAQTLTIARGAGITGAGIGGVAFGATTLSGGATLAAAASTALTLGATELNGNTLTINGAGTTAVGAVTSTGDASISVTGTGAATIASLNAVGAATLNGTGGQITVSGAISVGGTGLLKTGGARAILSGTSTYATGTTISGGVVEATANGALGTGAVVVNTGATLEVNLANATYTASSITANAGSRVAVRNVTLASGLTLAGGNLGTRTADAGVFAGAINVTADSSATLISYTSPANNLNITISGKLSGSSALAVLGGATANAGVKALILTNTTNDFSGAFNVASGQRLSSIPAATGNTLGTGSVSLDGGFLRLNDNGTGSNITLPYGNNITIGAGGGTMDLDRVSGIETGNTFALGGLTLGSAALVVNGANDYKASFATGTLTGDATINNAADVTISGVVSGGFGITKSGVGKLSFAGANSFTGTTTISGGSLDLSGSLTGALAIGATARLSGGGSVAGVTTVGNAAILNPGTSGVGTLTLAGLTFGAVATDTATVNFAALAVPDANNPAINVTGAGGLVTNGDGTGVNVVTLNLTTALPAVGVRTIINYDGTIGGTGFSAFKLGTLPNPRIVATLNNNTTDTRIELDISAVDAPKWSGAFDSQWTTTPIGGAKNWNLVVAVGTTDYIAGDNVLFDDTATANTTVDVAENVTPTSVVFDNTTAKDYTVGGTFAITGTTGLVKTKNGKVTISNVNSFTGAVSIDTGTVSVNTVADGGANSALGAGTSVILKNGGILEFTGASGSTNRAIDGNIGGGKVKVSGASTLTLAGAIVAAAPLTLENAGTLTVSGNVTANDIVTLANSGTLSVSGTISGPVGAVVSGAGTTTLAGNVTSALTNSGAGTTALTAAGNNPSSTTISAGTLQVGDGTLAGSTGTGLITNNATLAFNTATALTATAANAIVGTGVLTKTGPGTVVLSGAAANTYSGDTTVSGGTLILSKTTGVNAIGGNLIVGTGATVAYGTTAGQLADHIPDGANLTINGGTFGSGAGASLLVPTEGVTDTVAAVILNGGTFLSGRNTTAPVGPFTITGALTATDGNILLQRGGRITTGSAALSGPAVLNFDGGTTAGASILTVNGGISLAGTTVNMNAGPSLVVPGSAGSILNLNGSLTSTGTTTFNRISAEAAPRAQIDLNGGTRGFNVTGTLTLGTPTARVDVVSTGITPGSLVKSGSGNMILGGTNTYTGDTVIEAGTLTLTGSLSGSANIDVQTNTTFDVSGVVGGYTLGAAQTLKGLGTVVGDMSIAGTLSPNTSTSIGALTFSNNLTLAAAIAQFDIHKTGVTLTNDEVFVNTIGTTLTLSGTLNVTATGSALAEGDRFDLFDATTFAGTLTQGIMPALPAELAWDISNVGVDGSIVVVPEPGSAALLVLGSTLLFRRRRQA